MDVQRALTLVAEKLVSASIAKHFSALQHFDVEMLSAWLPLVESGDVTPAEALSELIHNERETKRAATREPNGGGCAGGGGRGTKSCVTTDAVRFFKKPPKESLARKRDWQNAGLLRDEKYEHGIVIATCAKIPGLNAHPVEWHVHALANYEDGDTSTHAEILWELEDGNKLVTSVVCNNAECEPELTYYNATIDKSTVAMKLSGITAGLALANHLLVPDNEEWNASSWWEMIADGSAYYSPDQKTPTVRVDVLQSVYRAMRASNHTLDTNLKAFDNFVEHCTEL